jgi:hypothetical protein
MKPPIYVSQYKYDDVIEAYVVSTDEYGNFLNRYLFKLWLQPQLKQLVLVSLLTWQFMLITV